jgi:hypothetical protein
MGEGARFEHGIANNPSSSPAPTPPSNSSTSSPSAGHTSASYLATAEAVLWATRGSSSMWISRRCAGARTAVCHSYVTPSQYSESGMRITMNTWKVLIKNRPTSTTENTSNLSRQQSAAAIHSSRRATSPRSTRRRRSRMSRLPSGKGWLGCVYMFAFNKDDLHHMSALSW